MEALRVKSQGRGIRSCPAPLIEQLVFGFECENQLLLRGRLLRAAHVPIALQPFSEVTVTVGDRLNQELRRLWVQGRLPTVFYNNRFAPEQKLQAFNGKCV